MYLNVSGCTISIIKNNSIYLLTRSSQVYEIDNEIFECIYFINYFFFFIII